MSQAMTLLGGFHLVDELSIALQRRARIDDFAVDRSALLKYGTVEMPRWSPEAESREPKFQKIREAATLEDRVEAWRYWLGQNNGL